MTILAVRDFSFRYPAQREWAVEGVTLSIVAGEVTWVSGALGSGTSSLLLALAGLAPRLTGGDATGDILLAEHHVSDGSPLLRGIGYLGSSPALQLSGVAGTVHDEISVGPMNLGWPRDRILALVAAAMARLDIAHLAHRAPDALSGGETQRVLLAGVLAASPTVWLLDEPFSALDRTSVDAVRQLIRELAAAGHHVVVACDDPEPMLNVADRLLVMKHGQVVMDGLPLTLLASDELFANGMGTSDAATLALEANFPAPRPVLRDELLASIGEKEVSTVQVPPGPLAPAGAVALSLEAISFGYRADAPVLREVSFTMHLGEAVGLFGSNGAGKSTVLRLAMALEQPWRGAIRALGQTTAGRFPEHLAPDVGFLFQQPERQLFAASVRAECSLAPSLAGWDVGRTAESVATVLEELGLSDTAEQHPYDLPLARRRLVALAAILVADPRLILLDEPTAGLDFTSRERVIRAIQRRVAAGKAILAITHDAGFAHEALDRGLLLASGAIVQDGPVRDVIDDHRLRRPAALAVAMALGLPPGADRRNEVAQAIRHG